MSATVKDLQARFAADMREAEAGIARIGAAMDRERRFALVVRRALLLIVRFIEAEYGITSDAIPSKRGERST